MEWNGKRVIGDAAPCSWMQRNLVENNSSFSQCALTVTFHPISCRRCMPCATIFSYIHCAFHNNKSLGLIQLDPMEGLKKLSAYCGSKWQAPKTTYNDAWLWMNVMNTHQQRAQASPNEQQCVGQVIHQSTRIIHGTKEHQVPFTVRVSRRQQVCYAASYWRKK